MLIVGESGENVLEVRAWLEEDESMTCLCAKDIECGDTVGGVSLVAFFFWKKEKTDIGLGKG